MHDTVEFHQYLEAKRVVDDRSLNRRVWDAFADALSGDSSRPEDRDGLRRMLEIGAGSGTMVERLAKWGVPGLWDYTGIEPDPSLVAMARHRAAPEGWRVSYQESTLESATGTYDAILAHAVLDILPAEESLRVIRDLLTPGGILYATITFDGLTAFEPVMDHDIERSVIAAYHLAMDSRHITGQGNGGAKAGRRLIGALPSFGFDLVAAGSSDWVIAPRGGGYVPEELVVVRWLLQTMKRAVTEVLSDSRLESERQKRAIDLSSRALEKWIARRLRQLSTGELVAIAHQLDFCTQILS